MSRDAAASGATRRDPKRADTGEPCQSAQNDVQIVPIRDADGLPSFALAGLTAGVLSQTIAIVAGSGTRAAREPRGGLITDAQCALEFSSLVAKKYLLLVWSVRLGLRRLDPIGRA